MDQLSFAWVKMLSANNIAGLINQTYLKSSWVNQRDFLHAD